MEHVLPYIMFFLCVFNFTLIKVHYKNGNNIGMRLAVILTFFSLIAGLLMLWNHL